MKSVVLTAVAAVLSFAAVHLSAQATVREELVKLKTKDGIVLDGALWTPATGTSRVGVVIAPGGTEFYGEWLVWLGRHFAQSGYIALSMNRRDHGPEQWHHKFEAAAMDHQYMVDMLAARGVQSVVLAGQSYGTVTAPFYVATSNDPRVKALVLYAAHGFDREGLKRSFGSAAEYDQAVERARQAVASGQGKESFLLPPISPGGRPRLSSYEAFLNNGGPSTSAMPVDIIRRVSGRPMLAFRDPADPLPATIPPAQQRLQAANKDLEYVLLPDIRGGRMDPAAHGFAGREEEVFRITLAWLAKHGLAP